VANRAAGIPNPIERAEANRLAAGNACDSAGCNPRRLGDTTAVQFDQLARQPSSRCKVICWTEDCTHSDLKSIPSAGSPAGLAGV